MKKIIICLFLVTMLVGTVFADECCSKWMKGPRDGEFTAWTNEGMRHQEVIQYCPECGKKLRAIYGYYVAIYRRENSYFVACESKFFKNERDAQRYVDERCMGAEHIMMDIIHEDEQ